MTLKVIIQTRGGCNPLNPPGSATAATFSPRTRETPDLVCCCKNLSPIDRRLLSPSLKRQKPVVCRKVRFKMQRTYSPSARVFEGIK